jgi:hypothetical protein
MTPSTQIFMRDGMDVCVKTEWGFELMGVIPYAYALHKRGLLRSTTSSIGTRELYYFSPNHNEKFTERTYARLTGFDNEDMERYDVCDRMWEPPPYKTVFYQPFVDVKKEFGLGDKLCIVHNKLNIEWSRECVHFIDPSTLAAIFGLLRDSGHDVIYIRPTATEKSQYAKDHNETGTFDGYQDDFMVARKFGVRVFQDLLGSSTRTFNELQFALCAGCDRFVSVQGGGSVTCSYFGGTNIIYAREGAECRSGAYQGYFRRFSGCDVIHVETLVRLVDAVKDNFMENHCYDNDTQEEYHQL